MDALDEIRNENGYVKLDEEIKNKYREGFRKNNENLYLIEDNLKMSMSGFSDFV